MSNASVYAGINDRQTLRDRRVDSNTAERERKPLSSRQKSLSSTSSALADCRRRFSRRSLFAAYSFLPKSFSIKGLKCMVYASDCRICVLGCKPNCMRWKDKVLKTGSGQTYTVPSAPFGRYRSAVQMLSVEHPAVPKSRGFKAIPRPQSWFPTALNLSV